MDASRREGGQLSEFSLDDTAGTATSEKLAIPFPNFTSGITHRVSTEGHDFALIYLPKYYRKCMEAVGKLALSESTWRSPDLGTYDVYWMLGVPEEFINRPDGSKIDGKTDVLLKIEAPK